MPSLLILAALGVGAYLVFSSSTASASNSSPAAAGSGVASAATQNALAMQAYNAQAASAGLTPDQAQMALQLGMSPQDYATRLGL
jgi:hypothetical protein